MVVGGEKQQLMYLVVLQNKHTTKTCLRRFVEEGGITVLHEWLSEARKDFPKRRKFLLRLLDTLAILPIGLEALKKSQLGKTVKAISKLNDPEISDKAQRLVSSWMGLVTPQDATSSVLASAQSQAQPTDAPRKRSLYVSYELLKGLVNLDCRVEVEQGAKKKTKMVVIRDDSSKIGANKVSSKLPTTPPKSIVPSPNVPISKNKAPPKQTPTQLNQTSTTTGAPQQQPLPQDDDNANKPKMSSGKSSGSGPGDDLMNQLNASKKVTATGSAVTKKKVCA
jgi:hypothetical protein